MLKQLLQLRKSKRAHEKKIEMCVNKLHKLSAVETCLSELGKNLGLFQLNYKGALKMTNEQTAKCKN